MSLNQGNHYILWEDSYSVKIKVIDEQHKKFIGIMNQLHDEVMALVPPKKIKIILSNLIEYAAVHFATEEDLFAKYDYPETARHIKAHNDLKAKLTIYMEQLEKGEDISVDLLDFIEDWLVYHLQYFDQKYSKFLNDKGVF